MRTLDEFTEWATMLRAAKQGQKLPKQAVLRLLADDGADIPPQGRELLAGLLSNRFEFQRGRSSDHTENDKKVAVSWYLATVDFLNQKDNSKSLELHGSNRENALAVIANRYGVDPRTIQRWIDEDARDK